MAWIKIPKEHHPVFAAALPKDDRIATKQMFGGLAAMLNGQMMAGLFGTTAMLKLAPADYAALVKKGGKPFDPMGNGRPMAATLMLPEREFQDPVRLAGWLAKSRDYVATLPAKSKTSAKPPKTAAASKRKRV
jgi:TfoX/Sxy family transcriptional regulator of competence genes